ncbi:tumor necrosis factor ligand superfamily member 15-like [Protopterus annectens]|uniref:tumor necrosis factor ligand superfamily member 15-like n=1 Tax=Protopterus annectens TaxID=7888 RepID=UPI001CFA192A|nr:tumor necrosis factor ligand superfamily member 15-like [Protopterus annectens]
MVFLCSKDLQITPCLQLYSIFVTLLCIVSNVLLLSYYRRFEMKCFSDANKTGTEHGDNAEYDFMETDESYKVVSHGHWKQNPAAHLTGKALNGEHEDLQMLQWEDKRGMAFVNKGMVYDKGVLQVFQKGLYYIYAQAVFNIPTCHGIMDTSLIGPLLLTLNVMVTAEVNQHSKLLLTSVKSVCTQDQLTASYTTISQGAAFRLQKMDKVFVNVSHPSLVQHSEQKTFFGIFMS